MARINSIVAMGVAISATMVLAGCGADERPVSGPPMEQSPPASSEAAATTPAQGDVPEELRFTAKTVDGMDFNGASLASKPAVVWFWASWCPKCQAEAPGVRKAAEATDGSVSFLGVAALSDVPAMQNFVDRYQVGGFTHLADEDAAIWKRFGVVAQPAYAFVGSDGSVEVVTDRVSEADLLERARTLAG